jgi:hypothetical protein
MKIQTNVMANILQLALLSATVFSCASAPRAPKQDPVEAAGIEHALRARNHDVRACYENEPGNVKNGTTGTISIRFVLSAADGKVLGATIEKTTFDEPNVASCLLDVVISTRFPKPKGPADTQVVYPFHLGPRDPGLK